MSGHLDVTAIDPGVPATFSRKVLIDLLRDEMGFTGVVVSDALNMAPAKQWPPAEAAVRALLAGNDLLLMPPDLRAAQRGLLDALDSGRLPRARLVEAVSRVLTLKLGLDEPAAGFETIGTHADEIAPAAQAAVTVLRGSCDGPLAAGPIRVTTSAGRDHTKAALVAALKAEGVAVTATGGTRVHLVGWGDGADDLAAGAAITVAMDTPYVLGAAGSPTLVATYSSSPLSMAGLAKVIAGKARPTGVSPVPVRGLPRTACT